MQRCGEATIRRPPIPHQDTVEVRPQHRGRLVEATPRADPIHRGLRGRECPQPVPHRTDAPAGFVGADHGTAADLLAQRGVGRGGYAGGAMQHVHEASGRHAQPEALPQERGHLRERHADFFVQARHQRDGARPQVDVGGPDRVRGLQGMSTLHAASTLGALPDGHIKAPHDRLDAGKVFLVLRRDVKQVQCPATPRTRRGKRGRVGRIDAGGNRAPCPAPIPAAGPSPRLPTAALGPILGERRGLPEPGPSRGRELLLQPLVLPLQPIVRTLQPIILTSQLIVLTLHLIPFPGRARRDLLQPRDLFVVVALPFGPLVVDGMRAFIGHARFMADSRQKYKYKIVISTDSPAKRRPKWTAHKDAIEAGFYRLSSTQAKGLKDGAMYTFELTALGTSSSTTKVLTSAAATVMVPVGMVPTPTLPETAALLLALLLLGSGAYLILRRQASGLISA